jgi:hypothetical protein
MIGRCLKLPLLHSCILCHPHEHKLPRMATEHDHFAAERRRVKEAFEFFDREGRGLLVKEEVGTIMRYLGAFPSEDALVNEILPQARGWLFSSRVGCCFSHQRNDVRSVPLWHACLVASPSAIPPFSDSSPCMRREFFFSWSDPRR